MVSRVVSFTSSREFFDSCIPPSFALLQTPLSKEPLEILDASTTFDFLVSVCNSNLFCVIGCLSVFVVGGVLLVSMKVFRFLVYVV